MVNNKKTKENVWSNYFRTSQAAQERHAWEKGNKICVSCLPPGSRLECAARGGKPKQRPEISFSCGNTDQSSERPRWLEFVEQNTTGERCTQQSAEGIESDWITEHNVKLHEAGERTTRKQLPLDEEEFACPLVRVGRNHNAKSIVQRPQRGTVFMETNSHWT